LKRSLKQNLKAEYKTMNIPKIRGKTGGRNGKELEQFVCIDLENTLGEFCR
jgi:hypothetical protein